MLSETRRLSYALYYYHTLGTRGGGKTVASLHGFAALERGSAKATCEIGSDPNTENRPIWAISTARRFDVTYRPQPHQAANRLNPGKT